jgi:hypothetical protein
MVRQVIFQVKCGKLLYNSAERILQAHLEIPVEIVIEFIVQLRNKLVKRINFREILLKFVPTKNVVTHFNDKLVIAVTKGSKKATPPKVVIKK